MARRPCRNHTAVFRARVALSAIRGAKTLAELAEQFDVHPNQITDWKNRLQEGAAHVLGELPKDDPAKTVDVKAQHAKIGELTLENDSLESALTKAGVPTDRSSSVGWKAGLLSARR